MKPQLSFRHTARYGAEPVCGESDLSSFDAWLRAIDAAERRGLLTPKAAAAERRAVLDRRGIVSTEGGARCP